MLGWARTYVAFSPRRPPTEALAGRAATGMANILYLAAENDGGGQAADSQSMYDATAEPRGIEIATGNAHGIDLMNQSQSWPQLWAWLETNL